MADRAARQAKLEALRAAKGGGSKAAASSDGDVYTLVPDDVYHDVVRSRLAQDDFIEDDDGSGLSRCAIAWADWSGYVDNGMDDWDREGGPEVESDDEEDERRARKRAKAEAKAKAEAAKPKPKPRRVPAVTATEANPYKRVADVQKEEDFMSNILGDLASGSAGPSSKASSRVPSLTTSSSTSSVASMARKRKANGNDFESLVRSSTASSFMSAKAGAALSSESDLGTKKLRLDTDPEPEHSFDDSMDVDWSPVVKLPDPEDDLLGGDEEMSIKPLTANVGAGGPKKRQLVNVANSRVKLEPAAGTVKAEPAVEVKPAKPRGMDWRAATELVNVQDASAADGPAAADAADDDDSANVPMTKRARAKVEAAGGGRVGLSKVNAFEKDSSLRFYWLDCHEADGVLHLLGKVLDKDTGRYVSACLSVEGIERNVYLLPRGSKDKAKADEPAKDDDDANSQYSADWESNDDDVPSQDDVYEEFDSIRQKHGIGRIAGKFVKRKYAFETRGIPSEAEWFKVAYSFDDPELPLDLKGRTFSHVLGTNTSAFELFVLKRKIMGPCWLDVKGAELTDKGMSWSKFEAVVKDPKSVNPFSESAEDAPKEMPPLTIMSLSIRSIMNLKENRREIVCATAHVWQDASLDDTTPIEKQPCSVHTVVRPLTTTTGSSFPKGFEEAARASKSKIVPMKAERMLLNSLLATIQRYDPDVIVGHDFVKGELDVLLHRMRDLKADHWSRIGRLRRPKWPRLRGGFNGGLLRGRLICDLKSEGVRPTITSTTWSMTEMCLSHLKVEREDIDPEDTADYFDSHAQTPDRLLEFVQHNQADSFFQMALAHKVQALALTKQLTTLAGLSWARTLAGGRSERNEYILLHEFHRQKYVCPDKLSKAERVKAEAAARAEMDDDEAAAAAGKKKDKFKGGLVFDPKRGLYDKFILVMDFNSLYPSIIQEYNIDFTTVERVHLDPNDNETMPELPSSDLGQGVLPRLIATLVQRRRQVKSLMKDKSATPAQLLQYDIRQLALKLTANSMYGCLGFEGSRFYARPLAALTTFKGREILGQTKDLAESQGLEVIYGDTDSVMINTNVTDFASAQQIGVEFKKLVNERYRLLEIDIDNVFARMLLLQKKKYAALNMNAAGETSTEVKGLDMKRREYCELNKNVSNYVLKQILSGETTDVVVERIHDYLRTVGEGVRAGNVALSDFIINKRLGKEPAAYPDAKSLPHVQVALRMIARGQSAKAGDVVPYIICLGDDGSSVSKGGADRAKHPDEIRRSEGQFKPDYDYYLEQQILTPLQRLTGPIDGTDESQLAGCLGITRSRHSVVHGDGTLQEREFHTLDSQLTDADRFRDVDPLTLKCRHCGQTSSFGGLLVPAAERPADTAQITGDGLRCSSPTCAAPLEITSILVQLELAVRTHIARFYAGWLVCDDPSCANRTRMMSVLGRRCLRPACRGTVRYEYSDARLYTQLLYYSTVFDAERARQRAGAKAGSEEVVALAFQNEGSFRTVKAAVDRYLARCGRRYVQLGSIFSFMRAA